MKKYLWIVLTAFILSCRHREETVQPTLQNITESVYASGVVKSINQYEVYPTTNGIIEKIFVTEGDIVHKGEIIMSLVQQTPRLNEEISKLAASYGSEEMNRDKLAIVMQNIELARLKMQTDSSLYHRQQNLWNEGIGSRNDLEQRELAWKSSATAYQSYVLQYEDLKRQLQFDAKHSSKNFQLSSSISSDYSIRAGIDGKVYNVFKKAGEIATIQTPLAIIGDANKFLLELQVDEYDITKIRIGQQVFITMDSYKSQLFEGVVTKIDPLMNELSRTFKVEATFSCQPSNLYPNLTVEANVLISSKQRALTIPRAYLLDEHHVVLKDGQTRKIVTGLKDYQVVEIVSGLSEKDIIKKPSP